MIKSEEVSISTTRNDESQIILHQLIKQLDDIAEQVGKDEAVSLLECWMIEPSDRQVTKSESELYEMITEQLKKSEEEKTNGK